MALELEPKWQIIAEKEVDLLRQLPLCHPLSTEMSILDGGSHVLPPMQLRNSARV